MKNWQSEFDNRFVDWNRTVFFSENTTPDDIKSFISNLLSEQRKEIKNCPYCLGDLSRSKIWKLNWNEIKKKHENHTNT